MIHLQLVAITVFLHVCSSLVLPERDDVESLLYVIDNQPVGIKKNDIEAERRSILDKNFFRFGRSGPTEKDQEWNNYNEYDFEVASKDLTRPTRSGNDNTDNFLRFGRGNSDFIRFGRDPGTFERIMRDRGSGFIRFGRDPLDPWLYQKRNKREVSPEHFKRNSSMFLRFGKNDNFMRFGRTRAEETAPSTASLNSEEDHLHGQNFLRFIKKLKQIHDEALLAKMRHDRAKYERLD